jgi:hypothetical protein
VPALNLAICWKLWNIDFAQSAGNLLSLNFLGIFRDNTPEFICCIVLFFHCFPIYSIKQVIKLFIRYELYRNYTTSNNGSNTQLSSYVAGLIEGDGTIHVPKTERSDKGNLNYPSIQIVFHLKDLPLALLIQKEIGHGSIHRKKGVNANSLISDAWLSGFIEADGHFSVRTTESGKYPKIECKFELSQRQIDQNNNDNLFFLEKIAKLFQSTVKPIRVERPNPQYRVRTTNIKGNLAVIDYLTKYPLFGTKFLDFQDWVKVVNLFQAGKMNHKLHMTEVKLIKSQMNENRTIYMESFTKLLQLK